MTIEPCRKRWKGTMTDRERFVNQLHYRPIDRSFNMEFGYWEENFRQWDGFVKNNIRTQKEADRFFNFDSMDGIEGNTIEGRLWIWPEFETRTVSETETTRVVRDRNGLYVETPKDGSTAFPHVLKASVVTPRDWAQVKAERFQTNHPDRTLDIAALKKMYPPDRDYPLGVNCGSMIGRIRDMLTFEGLAYAIYDYPEMVEDMVETCCQLAEHALDQLLGQFEFDYASGWEDICFKNGPIVSVDFFEEIVVPRYQRIHKKLQAHGIDIWYTDCDGDVRPLLPSLMRGGINCLVPYEVMGAGHPGALLKQFGPELRIMGGVDKLELGKGRAAIRSYLESLVPLVKRGGYIPFLDHLCPPNIGFTDYMHYLDVKEELFGMK